MQKKIISCGICVLVLISSASCFSDALTSEKKMPLPALDKLPISSASPHPTVKPKKQSELNKAILKKYDTDPTVDGKKRYEAVLVLLSQKPIRQSINNADEMGGIALLLAAGRGYTDIVRLLLQKGANVNVNSKSGYTALIEAVRGGHQGVVKELLKRGVCVNKTMGTDGATALDFLKDKNSELGKLLKNKGAKTKVELSLTNDNVLCS